MSGKDILSLSSPPSLPMATCRKDRKHIVSALSANKDGKLYSPTCFTLFLIEFTGGDVGLQNHMGFKCTTQ